MSNDPDPSATENDRKVALRTLEAVVDLVAALDHAFNATDQLEAERPIASRQLRYACAMRAIGKLLRQCGRNDLQNQFFELAGALYTRARGFHPRLLEIDESQKPEKLRRGRRPD